MADEFYREEIIFDVNDDDAIRRAKRAEKRIKETFDRTQRRARALKSMRVTPIIDARDRMTKKVNKAERLVKRLGNQKSTTVIDAKDKVSSVIKRTDRLLDSLSKDDVEVTMEMRGSLLRDITRAKKSFKEIDSTFLSPKSMLKGSLIRELNRTETLIKRVGQTRVKPRVSLSDQVSTKLRQVNSKLRKVSSRAWEITITAKDRTFAVFRGIRRSFEGLRNMMTSLPVMMGAGAIALSPALVMGQSLNAAADFEQSMARVKAVSGATTEQFQDLTDIAREMGRTTEFTSSQSADALGYLSMAGFKAEESIKALPNTLDLATAGQLDLARAADIASNVLSGFRYDIDEYQRIVDVMAKTQSSANTNIEQLGNALSYAAPAAADAGQTIEAASAAIGLISDAGIQGERAGTSLRSIFSQLVDPTSTARKEMDKLGVSVTDSAGELKTLPDIIRATEKAGIKGSEAYKIFGMEAGPAFSQLLAIGSEELSNYITELENSEGAARDASKTMRDTLHGAVKTLGSAWESMLISIGGEKGLGPAARSFVDNLTSQLGRLETFIIENQDAIEEFGKSVSDNLNAGVEVVVDVVTSDEFKEADFLGKMNIAWDEFVAEPFSEWYNGPGRGAMESVATTMGEGVGSAFGAALMALAGIKAEEEDQSPFVNAGSTAASSFIEGFADNFELGKIVNKAFESLINIYSDSYKSVGNAIGAVVATAIVSTIISKIGKALGGGLLLKGIGNKLSGKTLFGKEKKTKTPGGRGGGPGTGGVVATPKTKSKTPKVPKDPKPPKNPVTGFLSKVPGKGALKKVPVLGSLLGIAGIASAKGGRAKTEAAGGMAGGLGGAAAGAAIGSVVPGLGTAVGGAVGGIAGSIGGDSLGRLLGGKTFDFAKKLNFGPAKEKVDEFSSGFKRTVQNLPKNAGSVLGSLGPKFGRWFGSAKQDGLAGFNGLPSGVRGVAGLVPGASAAALAPLGGVLGRSMGGAHRQGIQSMNGMPSGVGSVLGRIPGVSSGILSPLGSLFGSSMGSAKNSGISGVSGMPSGIGGILGLLPGLSAGRLSPLTGIFLSRMKSAEKSGIGGVRGMPGGVGGILSLLPGISSGQLNPLAGLFLARMKSAESSGISGVRGLPGGVAGIIARIAPSASGVFNGLLGTFRSWGSRLAGAVTSAFNQAKSTASSLGSSISRGASWVMNKITPHAEGGILSSPHVGLVAEDGPESIIPLSSKRRDRALGLWQQTGQALGVKPYAEGGMAGPVPKYKAPEYRAPDEEYSSGGGGGGNHYHLNFEGMVGDINFEGGDVDDQIDEIADEVGRRLAQQLRSRLTNRA
ncbi:phage tail tape measure protein [Halobacillus trueperi]|uniref:Phage tail tape measure protein n=1 Tax=Halobacillus trueperi TaxID=156205 RepID=A0A3D8VLV4_9BACI|nr:phage tail tape measure protein [Halobacillus trueperi]RDY70325.1 phage tail tape measure protein [Halobacillus trueperi]